MITFPYMVRSETALSFIGLGLTDPVNSLGALMQRSPDEVETLAPLFPKEMPWSSAI